MGQTKQQLEEQIKTLVTQRDNAETREREERSRHQTAEAERNEARKEHRQAVDNLRHAEFALQRLEVMHAEQKGRADALEMVLRMNNKYPLVQTTQLPVPQVAVGRVDACEPMVDFRRG